MHGLDEIARRRYLAGFVGQVGGFGSDILYELQQDGKKVTGRANAPGAGGGWVYLEGTIVGNTLTYSQTRGTCCGELIVSGDEMRGRTTTAYPVQVRHTR